MNATQNRFLNLARRFRRSALWQLVEPIYQNRRFYKVAGKLLGRGRGFHAVVGPEAARASDRGRRPQADEQRLQEEYRRSDASRQPDGFVLYRIVGNDIVPRHRPGQSRANVRFILENEPDLADCEKRWVLNRIVDGDEERAIRELLESRGQSHFSIPFQKDDYAQCPWDLNGLPRPGYTLSGEFDGLSRTFTDRVNKRLYRHKNNYVVNNNGARNSALADGKSRAKWILPWDGNCFLTVSAWREITEAVRSRPWFPYFVVPMARVNEQSSLVDPRFRPPADQEPQLLFRADSVEAFDERFYYGRRPKVEILWRLGVPGPWDEWAMEPWDLPYPEYCAEAGQFGWAGWVARLPSGKPHLESGPNSETLRHRVRAGAVSAFLSRLDASILAERMAGAGVFVSEPQRGPHEAQVTILEMLSKLSRHSSPRRRRESRRATRRIATLLAEHYQLPILLDFTCSERATFLIDGVLRWLRHDRPARVVRRDTGLAGTTYVLLVAAAAAKLGRYRVLSQSLLFAADRASLLFAVPAAVTACLGDARHRFLWQALDLLARRCGENIWQAAVRPGALNVAVGDAAPDFWDHLYAEAFVSERA